MGAKDNEKGTEESAGIRGRPGRSVRLRPCGARTPVQDPPPEKVAVPTVSGQKHPRIAGRELGERPSLQEAAP